MIDPELAQLVVTWLSPLLFGVGVAGVFARRSSLAMGAGIQVMVLASVLALVGVDVREAAAGGAAVGQAFGVTLVLLLAAQAVIASALLIARSRAAGRKEGSLPW